MQQQAQMQASKCKEAQMAKRRSSNGQRSSRMDQAGVKDKTELQQDYQIIFNIRRRQKRSF